MTGMGVPRLEAVGHHARLRVAVAAALWHPQVMDGLLSGALRALDDSGVTAPLVLRVPGTFELPLAAKTLADHRGYEAVVALGAIIRGGTPQFDYVCQSVAQGLTQVSVDTGTPIGFGVLICDTEEQALDRAGLEKSAEDKGYEAAAAALATVSTLRPVGQRAH
ncbi:6,7-dimethyl-8-ribityllumazine synthase [Streptomyces botrytidirepellens]|uniref:6,7-dimethyl-8-ribityllumazine synthase n=1 Tax=Streptomyces botrytidirepellens TaxID=2486417 RepID=A0A3M8SII4_9ACTN|nr:6,7-dimethyl-8-ribityllumazine synthase [Streptomyces botrytidirepellens]RNF81157.1 6,7-dimethyl-8-ribityllumazine synthase [Streptomyces botrytidirepellens]